jgi:hypothetical protein
MNLLDLSSYSISWNILKEAHCQMFEVNMQERILNSSEQIWLPVQSIA